MSFKLYREDEDIPLEIKDKGFWKRFGDEILFSPFSGFDLNESTPTEWECQYCHGKWYKEQVIKKYKCHCPRCGKWAGLI